jgi:hypothetical protein
MYLTYFGLGWVTVLYIFVLLLTQKLNLFQSLHMFLIFLQLVIANLLRGHFVQLYYYHISTFYYLWFCSRNLYATCLFWLPLCYSCLYKVSRRLWPLIGTCSLTDCYTSRSMFLSVASIMLSSLSFAFR